MLDLEIIKEQCQKMDTNDLIKLSKKPNDLREDVIPILIATLNSRGKREDALKLSNYKEPQFESAYKDLSLEEMRQMVDDRIQSGESIDSIKIDLRENGIDVFEILKEEVQLKEKVFGSITQMKQDGASSTEIDEHLEKTYNVKKSDSGKIKTDLKIKGKRNQTWGFVLIIISSVLLLLLIIGDNYRSIKLPIIMLISGISIYVLGVKQAKD